MKRSLYPYIYVIFCYKYVRIIIFAKQVHKFNVFQGQFNKTLILLLGFGCECIGRQHFKTMMTWSWWVKMCWITLHNYILTQKELWEDWNFILLPNREAIKSPPRPVLFQSVVMIPFYDRQKFFCLDMILLIRYLHCKKI